MLIPARGVVGVVGPLRALVLLALALLAAPSLLPGASAQTLACNAISQLCATTTEVVVSPPRDAVPPLGPFVAVPVTVRYTYVPTSLSLSATPIHLAVSQAPPWVAATVSPSTVYAPVDFVPSGVQPVTRTLSAFLLLSTTSEAPAFTAAPVEVRARAQPNGNLLGSEGRTQVPVQAGFFAPLQVAGPAEVRLAPGDGEAVPIDVQAAANGPARIRFEVAEAPRGVRVTPPGELTLESRQAGGQRTSATTAFAVEAARDVQPGDVVLVARALYALDERIEGGTARFVVHVTPARGASTFDAQALGPAEPTSPLTFGLLAAGAAGTVLLERRRRRRRA